MRARAGLLFLFAILVPIPAMALGLDDATPLTGPVALFRTDLLPFADHAGAVVLNPAAMAARTSTEVLILATDADDLRDGESAILLKMRLFGFGFERSHPIEGTSPLGRMTVALSRPVAPGVVVGASYAWFFSSDDSLSDLGSLDFGLLARPGGGFSLAATALGWNDPKFGASEIPRRYVAGLGYRPGAGRFAVSLEGQMTSKQSPNDGSYALGLEIAPGGGLIARGIADTDGDIRAGLEWNFTQSAFGAIGLLDEDADVAGRAGYLRLSDEHFESPRRGRQDR